MPRFVLDQQILIRGFQDHINAGLSGAADYRANFVPMYAWEDGLRVSLWFRENQGGTWIQITDKEGLRHEFAHLSNRNKSMGSILTEGIIFATSGNSGATTSGPHLHHQIIKPDGTRADPVAFWKEKLTMPDYNNKIIQNQEAGTPEAGEFSLVKDGKRRRITQERAGLAALDAQKSKREIIGVNSKIYHSIPQELDF